MAHSQQISAPALADEIRKIDHEFGREEHDAGYRAFVLIRKIWPKLKAAALSAPAASTGEPVAWRVTDGEGDYEYLTEEPADWAREWSRRYGREWEPLYAAPPASGDVRAAVIEELAADFEDSIHLVWDSQQIADRIREFAAGGQHG